MEFRTYHDLQRTIQHNLWKIPDDVDLIVGVPRSGMLVASMMALMLNLPMTDLDGFCNGRVMETGSTKRRTNETNIFHHALVVDDSSYSGAALAKVQESLAAAAIPLPKVTTCVIYGVSGIKVDIVMEVIDKPRIFEWNVLHHPGLLRHACLDIDGVLCHDPTHAENDDGAAYLQFLKRARPLYKPSHPIAALVTSRLEKYRPQTEEWLRRHNIQYGSLVMLDLPNAAARQAAGSHGANKASYYKRSNTTLFIESELRQADEIARLSGKPVLSLEGPVICQPKSLSPLRIRQSLTNVRMLARGLRGVLGHRATNKLRNAYLKLGDKPGSKRWSI
jgi:uncharacterized HAD superfamily protein